MKYSITLVCAVVVAVWTGSVEARFGQEQAAITLISQLQVTAPTPQENGVIATIGGGAVTPLLAAADPCALADQMDKLVEFGEKLSPEDKAKTITTAQLAMLSEKNFNPFATKQASVCLDPAKPKSDVLRGITPKVDPATINSEVANEKAAELLEEIESGNFNGAAAAVGKSIAQQMADFGFTDIQNLGDDGAEDDGAEDDGAEDDGAKDDGAKDDGAKDDGAKDDDAKDDDAKDDGAKDDDAKDAGANDNNGTEVNDTGDNNGTGDNKEEALALIAKCESELAQLKALLGVDQEQGADPQVADPQVEDPKVADPQVADPQVADPKVADPKVVDPKKANPKEAVAAPKEAVVDPKGQMAGQMTGNDNGEVANEPSNTDANNEPAGAGGNSGDPTANGDTTGAPSAVTPGQTLGDVKDSPIDLGVCTEPPTIEFAKGLNAGNPNEARFQPANPKTFGGQSTALNPVIIINFLCDRLNDTCKSKAAQAKCLELKAKAEEDEKNKVPRTGAIADKFNAEFGVITNFNAVK